jgi:hypothetical protein
MLSDSLDCPFVIAPLVFSDDRVYKTQDKYTSENTKGTITNGQSRESDNIGYTRHKTNTRQRVPKGQ